MDTRRTEEAIDAYTAAGWHLLPLQPGLKIPFPGTQGVKDATSDRRVLFDWLHRHPDMNLGLAMGRSKLMAIDIDRRSGGFETLRRLSDQGKVFTPTLTVATAQQGEHRYYHPPRGVTIKNAKGQWPGIDIKTGNGYVILPPSELVETENHSAGVYDWKDTTSGIKPLPDWVVNELREREETVEQVRRQARKGPQVAPGSRPEARLQAMCRELARLPANSYRNNYLFWATNRAAEMVSKGELGQHQAIAQLREAADACGLTPLEVKATIGSAFKTTFSSSE